MLEGVVRSLNYPYSLTNLPAMLAVVSAEEPDALAPPLTLNDVDVRLIETRIGPRQEARFLPSFQKIIRSPETVSRVLAGDLSVIDEVFDCDAEIGTDQRRAMLKWFRLCIITENIRKRNVDRCSQSDIEAAQRGLALKQARELSVRLKEAIVAGERLAEQGIERESVLDPEVVRITGATRSEVEAHRFTPEEARALRSYVDTAIRCRDLASTEINEADRAVLLAARENGSTTKRAITKFVWHRDLRELAHRKTEHEEEHYDSWRDIGKELK
ncbi:MAG TPA: hypothetical protein VD978_17045 [Azospirillum sp.]|nr:hypothetical protein [Azospirillum sp.]